jgi:RimJ/RimL family protein N-acetyltransferase
MEQLTKRLEGNLVILEPLEPAHADGLRHAARDPQTFQWLANLNEPETFTRWFDLSLAAAEAGEEGVFAVRHRGELVGSSRYMAVSPENRRLEIGWTWFEPAVWRSGVNAETKLLMLQHVFENLECVRVELKTDARNERSRGAMEALPAKFEGIARKHMIVPDVGQRDSAYFSILDEEWPAVRANLERRLLDRA